MKKKFIPKSKDLVGKNSNDYSKNTISGKEYLELKKNLRMNKSALSEKQCLKPGSLIVYLMKRIKYSIKESLILNTMYYLFKYKGHVMFDWTTQIKRGSKFEGANRIRYKTVFRGSLGYGSYIGPNCEIHAHIGRFSSIAPHVRTNTGIHPISRPFSTSSPMFYSTKKQNGLTFSKCD